MKSVPLRTLFLFLHIVKSLILYLFIFIFQTSLFGQNDTIQKEWILKGGGKDHAKLWSAPIRIRAKHLPVLLPLGAAVGAALYFDETIYTKINKFSSSHPSSISISQAFTYAGDGFTDIGIATSFYLAGHIIKNEKALQTGMLCYQAMIHTSIICNVSKMAFSRKRPVAGYGVDWQPDGVSAWYFFPAYLKSFKGEPQSNYASFPSGHTSTAWCIATVIAKQYKNTIWVPILSYSIATGVGISRMILNKHWSSDVLVGAALGYGVGHFLYKNRNNTSWVLLPTVAKKNVGLTGIYTF